MESKLPLSDMEKSGRCVSQMNTEGIDSGIAKAYGQSLNGTRTGDTESEAGAIRDYIRAAKYLVIPNHDDRKATVINTVLHSFGLPAASHLCIPTASPDLTRTPAINKALLALDMTGADLVIARGRLGLPGSGSMLVIVDARGRILSASLSPAHIYHTKSVAEAVAQEMEDALLRVGFQKGTV